MHRSSERFYRWLAALPFALALVIGLGATAAYQWNPAVPGQAVAGAGISHTTTTVTTGSTTGATATQPGTVTQAPGNERACPNGALHIKIAANGKVSYVSQTSDSHLYRNWSRLARTPAAPAHGYVVALFPAWDIATNQYLQDAKHLYYQAGAHVREFAIRMKVDSTWDWRVVNLDDKRFDRGHTYDIVWTWTDPTLPPVPAWLPFELYNIC